MQKDNNQSGWYFGWNIVLAASFLTMMTVGLRMGIGPFFLPMLEDLGLERSSLSMVIAIGALLYGVGMPLAGYLIVKRGTRFVMLTGTAIVVIAIIWTVMAKNFTSFFLAYGVLLSFGLAFTSPVAYTSIISHWFTRRRGMALFFLSTGSMAGIAVLTPIFTYTIGSFGWKNSLIGFAVFFTLLAIPVAIFIMRENAPVYTDLTPEMREKIIEKEKKERTTDTNKKNIIPPLRIMDAIKTLPFWKVCIGVFSCGFSMNLLGVHAVTMLIDHGFSEGVSGFGVGLIGLTAIFSTLILGRISDIVERRDLLVLIYFVRGLGFIGLVSVMEPWQLYSVAIICGFVWAGNMALSSAIIADLYGVKLVGVLYGWAYLGHQIGAMISSWLGGWAYQHYQTHWISFGLAAFLLFVGSVVSFFIPKRESIQFGLSS